MLDCIHVCVFLISKKLLLKAGSTPPRYLAVYRASSAFSNRNPDSFLIPSGSIENGFASSIATWHLVDRSSFCSWFCWVVPQHLLDTSAVDVHFSRHLPRQVSRYLSTPAFVEIYYLPYLSSLCDPVFISFNLSLATSLFSLPKLSHLTLNFVPQGFFKIFQVFLYLVSF